MAISYDISDKIKSAYASRLIADFDVTRVNGISEKPVITKTITNNTPEPYIFIQSVGSNEAWVTKDSEAREYNLMLQIVVKNRTNQGTHVLREEISNEVLRIVATDTDDYPDLSSDGFIIQRVTTGSIIKYDTIEKGARYYIANIPLNVTAALDEESAGDENPVQALSKTYSGFTFTPQNNNIEFYDSGTITYANTYASDNNGWDFTSVSYTDAGAGTLADNVLTLASSDTSQSIIHATINYQLESDTSRTTALQHTDTHNRIVSFRYGVIDAENDGQPSFTDNSNDEYGLRDFDNWTGTGKTVDHGTVNPNNEEITFNGLAGKYMYLITDKDVSNINALTHVTVVSNNIISLFDAAEVIGEYKVYISTDPLVYDGDITVTVSV